MESANKRIKLRKRRARRRRWARRLAVCAVLAMMAVTSSLTEGSPRGTPVAWGEEEPRAARGLPLAADHDSAQASDDEDKPQQEPQQEPQQLPDRSTLAWMMNQAALSPGHARVFADQYPELADLFLGAVR